MSKNLSRRDFLKGTAAGAVSMAAATFFGAHAFAEEKGIYNPGTYSATANGIGKVTVTMTFDANLAALTADGRAIPNLYVAGADADLWSVPYYQGGTGLGFSYASGLLAGEKAAENATK